MSVLKWMRLRKRPTNDGPPPRTDAIDLVNRDNRLLVRNSDNVESSVLAADGTPVQSVARVLTLANTGVGIDGEVFAIGDYYFELNASDGVTPSNVDAEPVRAQGTITVTGVATAAETIEVAGVTYTFRAVADYDADGEVGIPASGSASDQADYITTAINGADGINTPNPFVTARSVGATVIVTARNWGQGSEALTFVDAASNLTMDGGGVLGGTTAAVDPQYFPIDITATAIKSQGTLTITDVAVEDDTMTVGTDVYTFKAAPAVDGEIGIGDNALEQATLIVDAINGDDGRNTANASASAEGAGGGTIVITALVGGTAGDTIATTETFTPAGNVFDAATLGTTTAGVDSIAAEVVDAVVVAFTAFNASGEIPFTAVDAGDDATITSDLHGIVPNGYVLFENMANATLAQATAGVDGTAGDVGAQLQDGSFLYTLRTADHDLASYEWFRVAHATF